jgi:hypothetical protein
MRHVFGLGLAIAFLAAAGAASDAHAADRVTLTSGRRMDGVIVARNEDGLTLRTSLGDFELRTDQIEKIEKIPDPKPAAKPAQAASPVQNPTPAGAATPAQIEALRARLLSAITSKGSEQRGLAADEIVSQWPASEAALDAAIASPVVEARLEAVRLLGRKELGDQRRRIARCVRDTDPRVRVVAVRAARHARGEGVETLLLEVLSAERQWVVRQEVLRGLEDVGTTACLRPVLSEWSAERDEVRRARSRRVMTKVLRTDHGEDFEAWSLAVDAALTAARENTKKD